MDANTIADAVSAVVALVGLPLIYLQLRDLRKSQSSQAISNIYSTFIQLDRFFIENPGFRSVIYNGLDVAELPDHLQSQAPSVAEFVTDTLYCAFNQRSVISSKSYVPEANYIRHMFAHHFMRSYITSRADWYNAEFVRLALSSGA